MKLEMIILKNYKYFKVYDKYQEIFFGSKVNVIVGPNGSGKTAILDGVAVALSAFFTGLEGVNELNISKNDVYSEVCQVDGKYVLQPQYPAEILAMGEIGGEGAFWKCMLTSDGQTKDEGYPGIAEISHRCQERLQAGDTTLILPLLAYYDVGRRWDYRNVKKSDKFPINTRTNGYIDSLTGCTNIDLMMKWFRQKAIQEAQQGEKSVELFVVYGAMETYFEKITRYKNTKIRYNIDSHELLCSYQNYNDHTFEQPLSQLGNGYKAILSLIADIAYRMCVLNPQFGEDIIKITNGVVLIDEIELHLQPRWTHSILEDLQSIFPKIQFIVTTYSPIIFSSVDNGCIIDSDSF